MVKTLLKINKFFVVKVLTVVFVFIVSLFSFASFVLASDQINAGLLSDIWFSKLEIQNNDSVSIYGSFQNTSGKKIDGEVSFWVNDKELEKKNFNVEDNQVAKLESSWVAEVGDFDIKIVVNNLKVDGVDVATSSLLKNTALLKIKINRKIDIQYIKEVGTNVYNDTVKVINKVVDSANQSLETVKVRDTSSTGSGSSGSGSVQKSVSNSASGTVSGSIGGSIDNSGGGESGSVKGIQYSKEQVDKLNNANSGGKNGVSGSVVTDLKNRPLDALWNFAISALQFILKYWQISSGVLLALIIYFYFIRRRA